MQLHRIVALKEMGLSLEEIARLLRDDISIVHILDLLHVKQDEQKRKLEVEAERLKRVEDWLVDVEKEGKMPDYEIVIKKIAPQKVVSLRKVIPDYGHIGELFQKLDPYLAKSGGQMMGPPMVIYYDEGFKDKDADVELIFPVLKDIPSKGEIVCKELPGVERVAATIHKGAYNKVGSAYTALGKWIETNGYQTVGPCREIYFTDPRANTPLNEYITEVQMPIVKV
jgi:effector-binding domain-containing protein